MATTPPIMVALNALAASMKLRGSILGISNQVIEKIEHARKTRPPEQFQELSDGLAELPQDALRDMRAETIDEIAAQTLVVLAIDELLEEQRNEREIEDMASRVH